MARLPAFGAEFHLFLARTFSVSLFRLFEFPEFSESLLLSENRDAMRGRVGESTPVIGSMLQ